MCWQVTGTAGEEVPVRVCEGLSVCRHEGALCVCVSVCVYMEVSCMCVYVSFSQPHWTGPPRDSKHAQQGWL